MFSRNKIDELVDLFRARKVRLYHSSQFVDFKSYFQLGGIPSRKLLEECGLPYTRFKTDQTDKEYGVWDKVFLNLQDFGAMFAKGRIATPTAYGPIAFVFYPEVLRDALDVAICLRSAGGEGFQREKESLQSVDEVKRIFRSDTLQSSRSSEVKWKDELEKEFPSKRVGTSPEISCTSSVGKLSFKHLAFLRVDPYPIGERYLVDIVEDYLLAIGVQVEVKTRGCESPRPAMIRELKHILSEGYIELDTLISSDDVSTDLREWAKQLRLNGLDYQWCRFANYLVNGTLIPLAEH